MEHDQRTKISGKEINSLLCRLHNSHICIFCSTCFIKVVQNADLAVLVSWANIMVKFAFFSMQTYLTEVWSLSFTHAAAILNIWGGISWILPVFFLFLAEARIGHFKMIVISSMANCVVS